MQHKKKYNKTSHGTRKSGNQTTSHKTHHSSVMRGVITITKNATGFFSHSDLPDDIRIDRSLLNTALNGDTVELLILPKAPGERRRSGKVLNVLERARIRFVGTLTKDADGWTLKPDNQRVYTAFRIDDTVENTNEHHKALVEMYSWNDSKELPHAKIISIIGKAGENETEMHAILLEQGFASGFPKEVEEEAHALLQERTVSKEELNWRKDLRDVPTFTIDPDSAKDFDDALSFRKLPNGNYEVGIHIADVTHYVRPGTAIDTEAQKRATSVYLVDRTIPMLPEAISNDLCSLNPNEEKRAFSALFELNEDAEVVQYSFTKSLIRSDQRFTYRTAQDVLDGNVHKYEKELHTLWNLSKALRRKRVASGAIEFDSDEIGFELDDKGVPVRTYVKEKLNTMKLIEEFMLLANRFVAKYSATHLPTNDKSPLHSLSIYRIHEAPEASKIIDLQIFLRALGYDALEKDPQHIKASDLAKLLNEIKGTPEEAVIQMATLRAMTKAVYSDKNIGHFSLGFKYYTHFTSPIRRYPDMMVHRILDARIRGVALPDDELTRYRAMTLISSQREVDATRAERDSVKLKQVEYMQANVGNTFNGKITGVTKGGIFVAEEVTHAEGMVRMNALPGDWYELNEKHYEVVGRKTGKKYRIGDEVKIRLKRADLEARELDWEVIV